MAFLRTIGSIVLVSFLLVCVYDGESAPSSKDLSGNILSSSSRSLYEFGNMITCATNRSEIEYANYGCWCGYGGGGKQVDHVDKCCYVHDKCYDDIIASGICGYSWQVYFRTYEYTNCTVCQPASYYPSDDVYIPCRLALCACDSQAAKCFARTKYNSQHFNYDTTKC